MTTDRIQTDAVAAIDRVLADQPDPFAAWIDTSDHARADAEAARASLKEVRAELTEAVDMLAQIGDAISPTGERPEEALGTLVADVQALVADRDRYAVMCSDLQRELDGLRADHRSLARANAGYANANAALTAANARLRQQLDAQAEQLTADATLIARLRDLDEQRDRAYAAHDSGADFRTLAEPLTGPVGQDAVDVLAQALERYADQLRDDAKTADDGLAVGLLRAADGISDLLAADDDDHTPSDPWAALDEAILPVVAAALAAAPVPVAPAQEPDLTALLPWIRRALADPGSIAGRRRGPTWPETEEGWAEEQETLTEWTVRALRLALTSQPWCERCDRAIGVNEAYVPPLPGIGLWEHRGDCPADEQTEG
ncbi:hypothetical protein AB0875_12660 [Micromonospora gifhornensis]|uniref:hypothetical protein n=1 Tax=Micromonospora gifhornensis TaxID=84594 RepID=UPI003455457D